VEVKVLHYSRNKVKTSFYIHFEMEVMNAFSVSYKLDINKTSSELASHLYLVNDV